MPASAVAAATWPARLPNSRRETVVFSLALIVTLLRPWNVNRKKRIETPVDDRAFRRRLIPTYRITRGNVLLRKMAGSFAYRFVPMVQCPCAKVRSRSCDFDECRFRFAISETSESRSDGTTDEA